MRVGKVGVGGGDGVQRLKKKRWCRTEFCQVEVLL